MDLLRAAHHIIHVLFLDQSLSRSDKGHFLPDLHLVHETFSKERLTDSEAEFEVPPVAREALGGF